MHYYEVAPLLIVRSSSAVFTYRADDDIVIGSLVEIEVGKKHVIGLVMKKVDPPTYATKLVGRSLEDSAVPEPLLHLAIWISDYYQTHLATVLQTVLPRGLGKTRRNKPVLTSVNTRDRTQIVFNKEQHAAIGQISDGAFGSYVLQGVTGSGKTEVFKTVAKQTVESGRSVIILIPEISLTTQLVAEFVQDFPTVLVTHSTMTEAERHLVWRQALNSVDPVVVIGPRSALFMPVRRLGLIVVDEAHEPSYKQDQSPRYSALRAATMLGKFHQAKVVFASATPLVTERYIAEQAGRPIIRLTGLARPDAKPPAVKLVDMKKRTSFTAHRFLSDELLASIDRNVVVGRQSLIFHNRRGSASTTLCEHCGWTSQCPRCFIPLSLHGDAYELRCHVCDYSTAVPTSCPICHHTPIIHKGIGTKLIESELRRLFPKATIMRFDADNSKADSLAQQYRQLYDGTIDIAIGTQIIAKGLDLPKLATVGVIQADSGLALPDFTSSERTFQLLAQVIGRVGRTRHDSDVVVQTYQPDHPAIRFGLHQDYEGFYTETIAERQRGLFPPFRYLLKLTDVYKTEAAAIKNAQALKRDLARYATDTVTILGPTPAFYERQHDTYRWQLVLKSSRRSDLVALLQHVPPTHWQIDLDPSSLL